MIISESITFVKPPKQFQANLNQNHVIHDVLLDFRRKIKFAGVVSTSDASKVSELTKITATEKTIVNDCYVRGMTTTKHTVLYILIYFVQRSVVGDPKTWDELIKVN